ncbi:hypothetical protein [Carboxylicivirga sp. RSCT41]|uniref:hypothetical protein n=1 Tax=Carboxylicivirga agarovorans TaxID=3417570 RepID=UPI003D328FBF
MNDKSKDIDQLIADKIDMRQAEIDAFKKLLEELSKKRLSQTQKSKGKKGR